MSVINRMLLELDQRHDSTAQQQLPGMVRAVPVRLPAWYRVWLVAALVIALTALVGYFIWRAAPWKTDTAAIQAAPPASPETSPAFLISPPLQLRPSSTLSNATASATPGNVQVITEPPTPIPAPTALPTPSPVAPAPAPAETKKLLLPKRDASLETRVSPQVVIKTKPGIETTADMKRVSPEQQADFRYREALALLSQGRGQDAQTALEEALRLDPKNLAARQALLSIFLTAKRYPQAEQILQEGLRLNLAAASLASALASVQLERGDAAAALATLEKYASLSNGAAEYHGMYAALLQRGGRHSEAIEQFQTALKTHGNHANWLMGLGISLQAEKRNAEAEQAYSRARASQGLSPELQAFVEQRLQQVRQAR